MNLTDRYEIDGVARQREVYLSRLLGGRPVVPFAFSDLARAARRKMSAAGFAYIAGGAGAESTMRANRAAFDRLAIRPRMLRDVGRRQMGVELFGRRLAAPLLLAPIGVLEEAGRGADLAVARAAARLGIPLVFSNQASVPMERCAAAMGGAQRWFQLYYGSSEPLVASLVHRAEACGCEAVVVTLDTTLLGFRTRDLEAAYLPFLRGKGIAQYVSDPIFRREVGELPRGGDRTERVRAPLASLALLLAATRRYRRDLRAAGLPPPPVRELLRSRLALDSIGHFTASYSRPSLSLREIETLKGMTRLPVLVKGILHAEDAREAIAHGADGIIVSNHGGRQVDGAIAALDALPAVVDAVGSRVPVLFDSGARGGADLFKALALGARAVCLGRPYAFALAVGGERGVVEVVRNLLAELELTMALTGCRSIAEIDRGMIVEAKQ